MMYEIYLAATHDPNYATMAAMDKNVFGSDKRKKKKEKKKMQYAKVTIVPGSEAVVGGLLNYFLPLKLQESHYCDLYQTCTGGETDLSSPNDFSSKSSQKGHK